MNTIGVEFEWLAPIGYSRRDYAQYIKVMTKGSLRSFWHAQVEHSFVPGKPIFHNLTQGFAVCDQKGEKIVHTVGDITIQADLDKKVPSRPEWFRIVSDDARIINLIARHAPSDELDLERILSPIADLFGSKPIILDDVIRIEDKNFASIALGTGLLGERERVCEVVTGILHAPTIEDLRFFTKAAHALDFTIPKESATHIHFDATFLQNPVIFRRLVYFLDTHRLILRDLLQTNPNCVRLGEWPEELFLLLATMPMEQISWKQLQEQLKRIPLTKFCDFNIKNTVYGFPNKNTFELRILPGVMQPEPVYNTITLFQQIFKYISENDIPSRKTVALPTPQNKEALLSLLNLTTWQFWS